MSDEKSVPSDSDLVRAVREACQKVADAQAALRVLEREYAQTIEAAVAAGLHVSNTGWAGDDIVQPRIQRRIEL